MNIEGPTWVTTCIVLLQIVTAIAWIFVFVYGYLVIKDYLKKNRR